MSEDIKVGDKFDWLKDPKSETGRHPWVVTSLSWSYARLEQDITHKNSGVKADYPVSFLLDPAIWRRLPSSPTKEAESPALRRFKDGVAEIYASDIAKEAAVVVNVKTDGSFGGGTVTFKVPPMSEADICAATEKRNAAYHEEQAAAIKARWLEEQRNPSPYLAYGVVQAPGWQRRGWGRK
jgi:hypothetical protein